ncbi:MAG: PKD domain-containing protein, partial [Bacteroidetes bacterium]
AASAASKRSANVSVVNCNIQNVQNGVYARGVAGAIGTQDLGLRVINNVIGGAPGSFIGGAASNGGIHLINQANVLIENNTITENFTTSGIGAYAGILLSNHSTPNAIDSNITINANKIMGIRAGQAGGSAVGIRINLGSHTQDARILITNNVISRIRSVNLPAGIMLESNTANAGVDIYNNSISLTSDTLTGATSSACISIAGTVTGGVQLLNNILSNRQGKASNSSSQYFVYGISMLGNTNPFERIDNNLYDVSTNFGWAYTANRPAVAYASLGEWRTFLPAVTGAEQNGTTVFPAFSNDLDLSTSNGASTTYGDRGRPLLATDINGNARSTSSNSIGAYEFTQNATNVNAPLQGGATYFINGVNNFPKSSNPTVGSFNQLADFVNYLNSYGVEGGSVSNSNINVVISAGYANDTMPIPAVIPYNGMAETRRIILGTATGVSANITLTSAMGTAMSNNYALIRLNGVSAFRINGAGTNNGRNITFSLPISANNTFASLVMLTPTAINKIENVHIQNCNLIGRIDTAANSPTNTTFAGIYLGNPNNLSAPALSGSNIENIIQQNYIASVRNGISWRSSTLITDQRNKINFNRIGGTTLDQYIGGGAANLSGMLFTGIEDTEIDSNIISNNKRTGFGGFVGLNLDGTTGINPLNVRITRNTIYNLGSTVSNAIGMRIALTAPTRNITISNNFIAKIYGPSVNNLNTAPYTGVAGIVIERQTAALGVLALAVSLVNNTVHLSQTNIDVTAGALTSAIHYGNNVGGVYSRNNIFSNTNGRNIAGARANTYAMTFGNSAQVFTDNNANVYFAGGLNSNNLVGIVGSTPSVLLHSMQELRAQNTVPQQLDGISFFGQVPFLTDSTTAFDNWFIGHIADACFRDVIAVNDIRGLPRNFTTSVGALEVPKVFGPLTGGAIYQVNGVMSPPTVGSPFAGSFNTVNNLFKYINANGVDDANPPALPITIEITGGYTGEGDTLITPLLEYPKMGPNRLITIRPAAGANPVISSTAASNRSAYGPNDAVITLKGVQWLTIDGSSDGGVTRSLTIKMPTLTAANAARVNNSLTRVVELVSWIRPVLGVNIRNCNILGASTDSSNANFAGIYLGGVNYISTGTTWTNPFPNANTTNPVPVSPLRSGNNNNAFDNNFIGGVRYGVYLRGDNTTSVNSFDANNRVSRNIIGGNTFRSSGNPTNYFGGIDRAAGITAISQSNLLIDSNVISNNIGEGINATSGIELISFTGSNNINRNVTISRNIISRIVATNRAPAIVSAAYGIQLNMTWNNGATINVVNNMISGIRAPGSANTTGANFALHPYGIFADGAVNPANTNIGLTFYHNSINLGSTHQLTLAGSTSACLALGASLRAEIINNIFQNRTARTGTGNIYAVLSAATTNPFTLSNYNNYFASGVNSASHAVAINGSTAAPTNYSTVASWAAFTQQDTMSIGYATPFTNDTNLFIPATTASTIFRAGTRLPSVPTDILFSSRPSLANGFATMGAHEYVGSYADSVAPLIYDYTPIPDFCFAGPIEIRSTVYDANAVTIDTMFYSINGGAESFALPSATDRFSRIYYINDADAQLPNAYIRYRFTTVDGAGRVGAFLNSDLNSGFGYTATTISLPLTQGFDLPNRAGWKVQQIAGTGGWNLTSHGSGSNPALAPATGVRAAILAAPNGAASRLVSPCIDLAGIRRPTLRMFVSQNSENPTLEDSILVKVAGGFFNSPTSWVSPQQAYTIRRANASFAVPGYRVYDVCLQDYEGFTGVRVGIEGYSRGGGNIVLDSVVLFDNFFNIPVTPKNIINCYNKNVSVNLANADSKYEYSMYDMITARFIGQPIVGNDGNLVVSGFLNTADSAYVRIFARNLTSNCANLMDDTVIVQFRTFKNGPFVKQGGQFNGVYNAGTLFNPDAVKTGSTADYEIVPPSGTTNAGYGTAWTISSVVLNRILPSTPATSSAWTIIPATPGSPALVRVSGTPTDSNTLLMLNITLRILPQDCDSTVIRYLRVGTAPSVSYFIPKDTFCQGQSIQFLNTTENSAASFPVTATWDFGDGTTSFGNSPTKSYSVPGNYSVKLISRNNYTLSDSIVRNITILPSPDAAFTHTISCSGVATSFINGGSVGTGITYAWNFGNQTSVLKDPTVVLPGSDTLVSVRLIVRNSAGCTDTATEAITVFAQPKAIFTAANVCAGAAVQFNNTSTIAPGKNGGINTYGSEWQFGNGDIGFSNSPSYNYPQGGSYRALLKVISNFGCTDTVSKVISVFNKPVASFTVDNTCRGKNLALNNTSTFANGLSNVRFTWNFGDNSQPSNLVSPSKSYGAIGDYSLKLVALDTINGCSDSMINNITVKPSAKAEFTAGNGCANTDIQFTNLS